MFSIALCFNNVRLMLLKRFWFWRISMRGKIKIRRRRVNPKLQTRADFCCCFIENFTSISSSKASRNAPPIKLQKNWKWNNIDIDFLPIKLLSIKFTKRIYQKKFIFIHILQIINRRKQSYKNSNLLFHVLYLNCLIVVSYNKKTKIIDFEQVMCTILLFSDRKEILFCVLL